MCGVCDLIDEHDNIDSIMVSSDFKNYTLNLFDKIELSEKLSKALPIQHIQKERLKV